MTRAETIRQALMWEAAARKASARSKAWREQLAADARAEYAEQGTAPTWRPPGLAKVILPLSHEAPYVSDPDALLKWVEVNHPDEVEPVRRVRPKWQTQLLEQVVCDAETGTVHDGEGTVIPGLSVREGGLPQALTITPERQARAELAEQAEQVLNRLAEALQLPPVPDPPMSDGQGES